MNKKSKNKYVKLDVHPEDVFRLFEKNKRKASIADYALNNRIVPFPGFDVTDFNSGIWKVTKSEKYGNSYSLYIHSLRVTVELMLAFEATREIKYFDKAEEIILSWIEHSKTNDSNKMIWYDHTTANRTQALIHYIYLANELNRSIDYKKFIGLLREHSNVMSDDSIYKFNNHGLMMDRSLMILGYILDDELLLTKGKNRAINTFWYSFSSKGVHLENSPQYHSMVVRMYNEIESYLNKRADSLGEHIINYLKLSKNYIPIVTKPNQRLASIGDSGPDKQSRKKKFENLYDVEAGVSVLQYEKPHPMFTTFIAGYSSRVHKHKDDLSITLNYKNRDFLVDPGKYSYTMNKTRQYITSKEAHSSFYLKDFDYTIKNENRYDRKVCLETYYDNHLYTLVKGKHNDFDGSHAELTRTVIQLKESPIVLLVDRVKTRVKHGLKFEQNFNLDSDVQVEETKIGYILLSGEEAICVRQFINTGKSKIVEGNVNVPIAVNTAGFAKVKETKQLKFNKVTNERNVFVTALYDNDFTQDFDVEVHENSLKIKIDNTKFYIDL